MLSYDVIEGLVESRQQCEAEIARIDKAIAILLPHAGPQGIKQDYAGLGITEAARRFLSEVGEPKSTREVLDAIKARGVTTKSKKQSATVYATLTNSTAFKRVDDKWELAEWNS